ncbi:MAG TPA: hypothetical protein VFV87_01170 [Pirellulaceae bacterium]|nr:hypothetical protein [Pirellulaceae bacterium]
MDNNGLQSLLQFAPPPLRPPAVHPPNDKSWRAVETHFGFELPPDYKLLIEHYGTGCWGGFLQIFNPFSRNRYNNQRLIIENSHLLCVEEPDPPSSHPEFLRAWNLFRSAARARRAASPYDFYPARPGLFPWAQGTDEAVTLYWLVSGEPSSWQTIVERWSDGPTFDQRFEVGSSAFLLSWLQNSIRPAAFPEAARSAKGWFEPWILHDVELTDLG